MNRLLLLSVIIATVGIIGVGAQRALAWGWGPEGVSQSETGDWGGIGGDESGYWNHPHPWMHQSDWSSTDDGVGGGSIFGQLGHWLGVGASSDYNDNGNGNEGYNGNGYQSAYQWGFVHGTADAQYDHLHNLVYNNNGACCHSPEYWDGFHRGYDQQYNPYTSQEQNSQQTVKNYISINGDNNKVYLNDRVLSNQDQNAGDGADPGSGLGQQEEEPTPYQQGP